MRHHADAVTFTLLPTWRGVVHKSHNHTNSPCSSCSSSRVMTSRCHGRNRLTCDVLSMNAHASSPHEPTARGCGGLMMRGHGNTPDILNSARSANHEHSCHIGAETSRLAATSSATSGYVSGVSARYARIAGFGAKRGGGTV